MGRGQRWTAKAQQAAAAVLIEAASTAGKKPRGAFTMVKVARQVGLDHGTCRRAVARMEAEGIVAVDRTHPTRLSLVVLDRAAAERLVKEAMA